ncbi:MAG: hypothetical protein PVH68_09875 [Armatimonadota bacterium]|jgi:hypothetical protein
MTNEATSSKAKQKDRIEGAIAQLQELRAGVPADQQPAIDDALMLMQRAADDIARYYDGRGCLDTAMRARLSNAEFKRIPSDSTAAKILGRLLK